MELPDIDLDNLELIIKSKNRPGRPLYREDLPSVLFYKSPRKLLGKGWFDNYTKDLPKVCNNCGSFSKIERHEYYSLYRYKNIYIIKLEGVLPLCSDCHKKVHGGFSTHLGMRTGHLPEITPFSNNNQNLFWNKAKYLLVGEVLYPL